MANNDYKFVNRTVIDETTYVSTVRLWFGNFVWNKPNIFETMIFSYNKDIDWEQRISSTLKEAHESHKIACAYVHSNNKE